MFCPVSVYMHNVIWSAFHMVNIAAIIRTSYIEKKVHRRGSIQDNMLITMEVIILPFNR